MKPLPLVLLLLLLAFLLVAPWVFPSSYVRHLFILAFIYAIVASNWDLSQGYGGIFNFGHLAFFALGGYTSAILAKNFEVNPWLAVLAAGVIPALASLLIVLPVVRLKGIYVILVTFAFSQLCLQLVLSQAKVTGGSSGIVLVPPLGLGSYDFSTDTKLAYYFTALLLLIISTVFLRYLVNSDFGLSVQALRDNEDYAIARGVPLARTRLLTLVLSSIFTGLAGGFYSIYLRVISPDIFSFGLMSTVLGMLLLGGLSTIYGSILAALILTFVSEALIGLGPVRHLIIASLMVLVLRMLPGGLYTVFGRSLTGRGG